MADNCREWYHKECENIYHAQFGEQNPNGYAVCVHHISCLYVLFELFENSKRSATLQCSKNCVPFLWDAKLIL